jgi:hypothetical protein
MPINAKLIQIRSVIEPMMMSWVSINKNYKSLTKGMISSIA